MSYEVKGSILGFEKTTSVAIKAIDNLFLTMKDTNDENISFTLANPNQLREYSFDLPIDVKILLDIDENSSIDVYNIVVIQNPLENSTVNFIAPIVVNNDNKTIAQAILDRKKYPDFGMTESIKSFKE